MDDKTKKLLKDVIEEHGIEDILDIYLEDNCYSNIVDHLISHINNKLYKLNKIESVMKET